MGIRLIFVCGMKLTLVFVRESLSKKNVGFFFFILKPAFDTGAQKSITFYHTYLCPIIWGRSGGASRVCALLSVRPSCTKSRFNLESEFQQLQLGAE